jgi:hypothetical protein
MPPVSFKQSKDPLDLVDRNDVPPHPPPSVRRCRGILPGRYMKFSSFFIHRYRSNPAVSPAPISERVLTLFRSLRLASCRHCLPHPSSVGYKSGRPLLFLRVIKFHWSLWLWGTQLALLSLCWDQPGRPLPFVRVITLTWSPRLVPPPNLHCPPIVSVLIEAATIIRHCLATPTRSQIERYCLRPWSYLVVALIGMQPSRFPNCFCDGHN